MASRRRGAPATGPGPGAPMAAAGRGTPHPSRRAGPTAAVATIALLALGACRQDMHDTPRYEPLEASAFFGDRRSARAPVEGTVARGQLADDEHLHRGEVGGKPATTFPFSIDEAAMKRGAERFGVYCSPCHDRTGSGNGMVVRRGFRAPPSFHQERLREAPPGHFFGVITNGFGVMQDYATQLDVRDRWAVVAYVRALQLSQNARMADVPKELRSGLRAEGRLVPSAGEAPEPSGAHH